MQAARGTSLSDAAPPSSTPSATGPSSRPDRLWWVFAAVGATGLVLDQVSKTVAEQRLTGRPDVQVVGELLQLHLTRNPGAAFSTGTEFTVALSCLALVATGAVLWFSRRVGSAVWAVALGLLLAGITGNLGDRLFREPGPLRGHVVDFLMLPHWPVFNVADMCITGAAVLIVLQALRGVRLDGSLDSDHHGDGAAEQTPAAGRAAEAGTPEPGDGV